MRTLVIALTIVLAAPAVFAAELDIMTGQPATTYAYTALPSRDNPNVLWDLTHGVYLDYEPTGRYSDLVSLLAGNGFTVATTVAGVDNVDLSAYGILVIALGSAWNSVYSPAEVAAILDFVGNGGEVLVMADNTETPNANIQPVTQALGTTVGVTYLDPLDLIVSDFVAHPIFAGVYTIFLRAAGEVDGLGTAVESAFTDAGLAVLTILEPCGAVVIGDANFCENNFLAQANNSQFTLNLFNWLAEGCGVATEGATWGDVKAQFE